jgi:hypothetical protein
MFYTTILKKWLGYMSLLIFSKLFHSEAKGCDSSGNKKPQDPYLSVAREAACLEKRPPGAKCININSIFNRHSCQLTLGTSMNKITAKVIHSYFKVEAKKLV